MCFNTILTWLPLQQCLSFFLCVQSSAFLARLLLSVALVLLGRGEMYMDMN